MMIKNILNKLLTNYPTLWNMRLIQVLPIIVGAHLLAFLTGYILTDTAILYSYNYGNQSVAYTCFIILSILIFIGWIALYSRNNNLKRYYPTSPLRVFGEWFLVFAIICSIASIAISIRVGITYKWRCEDTLANARRDNLIVDDIKSLKPEQHISIYTTPIPVTPDNIDLAKRLDVDIRKYEYLLTLQENRKEELDPTESDEPLEVVPNAGLDSPTEARSSRPYKERYPYQARPTEFFTYSVDENNDSIPTAFVGASILGSLNNTKEHSLNRIEEAKSLLETTYDEDQKVSERYKSRQEIRIRELEAKIANTDKLIGYLTSSSPTELKTLIDSYMQIVASDRLILPLDTNKYYYYPYDKTSYTADDLLSVLYNPPFFAVHEVYNPQLWTIVSELSDDLSRLSRRNDNIIEAHDNPREIIDFLVVVLNLALIASCSLIAFRATNGKSWVIAFISLGVMSLIFGLLLAISSEFSTILWILLYLACLGYIMYNMFVKKCKAAKGNIAVNILFWLIPLTTILFCYDSDWLFDEYIWHWNIPVTILLMLPFSYLLYTFKGAAEE